MDGGNKEIGGIEESNLWPELFAMSVVTLITLQWLLLLPTVAIDLVIEFSQLIANATFVWLDVYHGLREIRGVVFLFAQDHRCDAFYWIDGELHGDWYKSALYEMYVSMNPEQRDLFEHEVNQHEREIESEQRIAALEEELRENSKMVDELKRAKSDVGRWRKISTLLLFVLCVMFLLLLVVL
ncbi:hypothetical protein Tco_1317890 [Tanacetum coccineum]